MAHPDTSDSRSKDVARRRLRREGLAHLIHAHQEALSSHPEEQDTREAILSLLEGVAAGEITAAHCVRLLRAQALRFADVHVVAQLYRQAAKDLERLQREAP